jgi:hypothetical protein
VFVMTMARCAGSSRTADRRADGVEQRGAAATCNARRIRVTSASGTSFQFSSTAFLSDVAHADPLAGLALSVSM